jgi:hypothetical protein
LLRGTFAKILTLVITICLLGGGIAPANPSCKAQCCVQSKSDTLHGKMSMPAADLLSDCCSDLKTAPCPRALKSSSEIKEYAIAAPTVKLNPVKVKIAALANNVLLLSQPHFHLAASLSPNIRGPSVPLYLQTRTLLI